MTLWARVSATRGRLLSSFVARLLPRERRWDPAHAIGGWSHQRHDSISVHASTGFGAAQRFSLYPSESFPFTPYTSCCCLPTHAPGSIRGKKKSGFIRRSLHRAMHACVRASGLVPALLFDRSVLGTLDLSFCLPVSFSPSFSCCKSWKRQIFFFKKTVLRCVSFFCVPKVA
jgi:hypothetical protein